MKIAWINKEKQQQEGQKTQAKRSSKPNIFAQLFGKKLKQEPLLQAYLNSKLTQQQDHSTLKLTHEAKSIDLNKNRA